MADESHCTTMSHATAAIPTVAALARELYQGDTAARPRPPPSTINMRVVATAASAPATMAPQEAAEAARLSLSKGRRSLSRMVMMQTFRSVPDQGEQDDDWNGNAEKPEEDTATHDKSFQKRVKKTRATQTR